MKIIIVTHYNILYIIKFIKYFQDYAVKKDRRGLLVYKSILQKQTESYYYADIILKSPVSINCKLNYYLFKLCNNI